MNTLVAKNFSIDQCKKNKDVLFIYGDNSLRVGNGGQAVIRNEENSIGFATKHKPSNDKDAFFTDDEYESNCKIIEEEIERIQRYAEEGQYKKICFSFYGIGTGLSQMPLVCPKTFFYLCTRLLETWGYNNVEGAFTK